ncbi:MAG: ATP-binding protein, partial [Candidatus Aenigmatarchaeota archaeon]
MSKKTHEQILEEGRRIREELEQGYIATKLSRIDASLIGRKIKFQALVVGEQVGKACEQYLRVFCNKCGEQLQNVDLLAEENTQVLYEKLAVGKVSHSALNLIRNWGECREGGTHEPKASFSIGECFDYSVIYVKELPENIETFSETEYQALTSKIWKVYYTGIPKEVKRIEIVAYPFKNPRNNEIEFLAREINPLSDEFTSLKITKEDHLKFIQYFRDNPRFDLVIENQVAPHIVGRNFEKLSLLLTLHSPYEIFDVFNSRKIRGCLRSVWIGDTKTGKTEIGKDITYLFYKIGEIVFGETSSRAGLTYTIDTDSRTIIWGAIPLNDRKFLFIDGIHSITEEEIEQMREVLEQEMVKVSRSVSGERLARVRLIATLNPRNPPMRNYYYKLKALMDTRVFNDPIDLTRWDIFIPFTLEDVPGDLIAEAKPKERPIPVEIFKKHILWAWSLDANKIRYSETAKERIVEFSKELYKWVSSNYPLIHAGVRDTLTRLSVAFACLYHSISEDFGYLEVKEEHVVKAKEFIEEMIQRIDYDAFVYRLRDQIEISDE